MRRERGVILVESADNDTQIVWGENVRQMRGKGGGEILFEGLRGPGVCVDPSPAAQLALNSFSG